MKNTLYTFLFSLILGFTAHAQVLNVPLIEQEQDAWCWNGVSKSALDYYGEVHEQCEIAEYVRTVTSRGFGNTPCCENPTGPCNQGNAIYNEDGSIQDILHHFAGITSEYKGQFGRTEADVANSIARNAVVPCGWLWATGGGHAVLIHGYVSGNVYYMDPWYGEGKKIASYSNFSSGSDGSDAGHHTWITGIYFTSDVTQTDTVVPCDAPNSITVSNISGSSVDLNWPVIASAQSYKIRYRAQGSATWINTTSSANSKTIANLSGTTTYEFQVASVCNSVSESSFSSTATATTLEGPVVYCAANGNSVDGEWINSVVFGSINNTSNANGGYADFTAQSTSITAGTSANITLTPGFASSWLFGTTTQPEFWSIWIDLNQDGDFTDANEQRFVSSSSSTSAVTAAISIPSGSPAGTTRMRIAMKRSSVASSCESFANGEVEDYSVTIIEDLPPTCDVVTNLSISSVTNNSFSASWSGDVDATSYNVDIRENGGAWTTVSTTTASYNFTGLSAETNYEVKVSTVCSFGNSAESNIVSATTLSGPVEYCSASGNSTSEWIEAISLGNINNTSGADGGYADFTTQSASIEIGASASLTITPGFPYSWLFGYTTQAEFYSVWIDLNQDGDFDDANELQYVSPNSNSGYQAFSVSLSIPASAALGETRLRIAMKRGSAANSCEALANGEVEDYTVNIVSSVGGSGRITAVGSISELESSMYPNPASDVVNIKLSIPSNSSTVTINLRDISGKWIQGETFESANSDKTTTYQMPLNQLTQGIYLVEVVTNTGDRQLQKLIVN
tara:strand:+ start:109506 stop:111887 length:2382 start_codon:yes stop_codon:yes gene_type:complete